MTPLRIALTTAAATLALLALGAAPASAAKPCWYKVQNDWYRHGQVMGTYPVHCYVEAIQKLPEDSKTYSSAPDDIRRAMLARDPHRARRRPERALPRRLGQRTVGQRHERRAGGFVGSVFDTFAPKNANGVPVPLIVLGAVALLLLLAGGGSVLARRMQARRIAVSPPRAARRPRRVASPPRAGPSVRRAH